MAFVIDASATVPWRFEDESTPWTEALLDRVENGEQAVVPAHWPVEVANTLLTALRKKRVTEAQVQEFFEDLAALPIQIEPPQGPLEWSSVLSLADQHRLTVYDAAYLDLAKRRNLPLATLDEDLRKAAQASGVLFPAII